MNKLLNVPQTEEKPKRKTPVRRRKKIKPVELATAPEPSVTETTEPVNTTTTKPAKPPGLPIPAMSETVSEIYIVFEDLGKEIFSDFAGAFTVAKRLCMAYATLTRTQSTICGVVKPLDAFVITRVEKAGCHRKIFARLKDEAEKVTFPVGDAKYVDKIPEKSVVEVNKNGPVISDYWSLAKLNRHGNCTHCGNFVGEHNLITQQTNCGSKPIIFCRCGTTLRSYYS